MKSQLFSKYDFTLEKDFLNDLEHLFSLHSDVLLRLPNFALQHLKAETTVEQQKVREAAARELGIDEAVVTHALGIGQFFLRKLSPDGGADSDSIESLVYDLKENFGLPADKEAIFTESLSKLRNLAETDVQFTVLTQAYEQAVIPALSSIATTVDMRAIFDKTFSYDTDVLNYDPKFMGTMPIGLVKLKFGGAETEVVSFQMSKRTLQILTDELIALQKQIEIAENNIKTNDV